MATPTPPLPWKEEDWKGEAREERRREGKETGIGEEGRG